MNETFDRSKLIHKGVNSGKYLYGIAYEYRITPGNWGTGFLYLHAESDGDARLQFFRSESAEDMKHVRVVGVAPVIGYHVNDNHGDDVSV